jgi:hypothetical protein
MSVYSLRAAGLAAEYAVKKYRSHWGTSQQDLDAAEEERMTKATDCTSIVFLITLYFPFYALYLPT